MNAPLTLDSLRRILGREVEEIQLTVARSLVLGLDEDTIAKALGVTKEEIQELLADSGFNDVKLLVGANYLENKVHRDVSWDGIESTALNRLAIRAERETDTDTLLKMAAVANRAQRRTAPPKEASLEPGQATSRIPLTLTRRYTEQLNNGQVTSRSETQQISVLDGSAVNPSFKEVQDLLANKPVTHDPATQETLIHNTQHNSGFTPDVLDEMVNEAARLRR